jgi:hypothetical protein
VGAVEASDMLYFLAQMDASRVEDALASRAANS